MKQVRVVKTVFVGLLLASGLQAKVEFEAIHIGQRAEGTFDLSRACALGFRPLREFFRENGVRFDPKLVHSYRGRYCHLYFEPTIRGFEAEQVGASWIAGLVNGKRMLLVSKEDAELIAENDFPTEVPIMLSKLRWHSSELELFKGGQQEQSRVLIYDEVARRLVGKTVRDEEYEYLLKVEFGVDAVKKKSKGR